MTDEPEVIEVTPLEYEQAVQALLDDIGYTRKQLAEQARCRSFTSLRARQAWLLVGPVPRLLFPPASDS